MPFAEFFNRAVGALLAPLRTARPAAPTSHDRGRPYPWESSYPAEIDWNATIEAKPLTQLLDQATANFGERICIKFRGRSFRYDEIGDLVDRAARGFRALGVHRGIKVALMLPNCPYTVICFYAVLKAGGTVVNINPLYAEAGIARLIADSSARILVTLNVKPLYRKAAPLTEAANPRSLRPIP